MCKRTREDIYEQMVQLNDTLCRIAVALETIIQNDIILIDFESIDWDVEDGE